VNPRATIALLIVTLLAVGGLFYLRKIAPATRDADELKRYAAVFDPEDIEEIDIVRGAETISLRRDKDAWQLTAPVTDRAAPEQVDRLLTAVRFLAVRDRNDSPDDAAVAEAGLASPRLRIDLRGEEPHRLELGANTALPGEVFARVSGKTGVLRVPDDIVKLATAPSESFRDPRLTQSVADDIEKFTVRRADGEMTLRRERGLWIIEKPVSAPADRRAVQEFLEPLLGLRVVKFGAAAPETTALPGQSASITMTPLGGGEDLNLEVMRGPDEASETVVARFAPRGGLIEVDAMARQIFEVSPESLRDKSLGYVETDAVDRISIESDGVLLDLRREGANWTDAARGVSVSTEEAARLIALFNETRAISFQPGMTAKDAGLETPRQRIAFSAWLSENTAEEPAGGHLIAGADFGGEADGAVYAREAGAEEIVTISPELSRQLGELAGRAAGTQP
jgi:hypothetical protein